MSASRQPPPLYFADREAFRAWAMQQPRRRWEREDGLVVAMAPERAVHARLKAQAWALLNRSIEAGAHPCEAWVDGMTVEVDAQTDYEPDVIVTCGERVADDDLVARNPVIVVEVLSPSTEQRDTSVKLVDYFRLPTVQHYLVVSATKRLVVHYRRSGESELMTRPCRSGAIALSPPGLTLDLAELYKGTDLPETPA